MPYAFPPTPAVGPLIAGRADLFPVRRVYCVAPNYAAHARETGFESDREPPFFFCKPNDNASVVPVAAGATGGVTATVPYLPLTSNYHFEAVTISKLDATTVKVI